MLKPLSEQQHAHLLLWYLLQHSLSSYQKLIQFFGSAQQAVTPHALKEWANLDLHKNHKQRASEFLYSDGQVQFQQCVQLIYQHCDFILFKNEMDYPAQLQPYDDSPPIIFGQGNQSALSQLQIAIVGSRKASIHGPQIAYDFSYYLANQGFYITSGMAHGIDHAAHQGGLEHQRTIAVIGTGLDKVYPAQNRQLQEQILQQKGTIISEFLPTTPPLQHHFPRRNRIISALSLGTLVVEATLKSGSLSTARWALEQGKSVFAIPGHIYSENHQGCHQLIREGAILVDNPEQIVQELNNPILWQTQQMPSPTTVTESNKTIAITSPVEVNLDVPSHLQKVYEYLDWQGLSIDALASQTQFDIADLTGQLMELELLGLCIQQAGLYLKAK